MSAARILLVDDDPDLLAFLARFLRDRMPGAVVATAEDVPRARELVASSRFDLVVSDYRIGDADGIDFLAGVRAARPEAMRVLMTGFAETAMALRAINEGHVHAFLQKPLNGDILVAALEKTLRSRAPERGGPPHGEILLVEDDPEIRQLVVSYFGLVMPEVHVDAVPTGEEGMVIMRKHHVDVILADYHLPDMTGSEFLSRAKDVAPDARTAIITGTPPRDLATDAQRAHIADRLFIKPMEMGAFARAVRHLLPRG